MAQRGRFDPVQVRRDFLEEVLRRATVDSLNFLITRGGSKTLQHALEPVIDQLGPTSIGRITTTYYWAQYVHDGRGPVNAPAGGFLIYFPRKEDDPRTAGGKDYPARPGELPKLTHDQFLEFLRENYRRKKLGQPPIMVVAKFVHGTRVSVPFFDQGLEEFRDVKVDQFAAEFMRGLVERIVGPAEQQKLTVRLR